MTDIDGCAVEVNRPLTKLEAEERRDELESLESWEIDGDHKCLWMYRTSVP